MRYFLTGRLPKVDSILLVESGTRGLLEGLIGGLREAWGDQIPIDLFTCYATLPKGSSHTIHASTGWATTVGAPRAAVCIANSPQPLRAGGDHLLAKW